MHGAQRHTPMFRTARPIGPDDGAAHVLRAGNATAAPFQPGDFRGARRDEAPVRLARNADHAAEDVSGHQHGSGVPGCSTKTARRVDCEPSMRATCHVGPIPNGRKLERFSASARRTQARSTVRTATGHSLAGPPPTRLSSASNQRYGKSSCPIWAGVGNGGRHHVRSPPRRPASRRGPPESRVRNAMPNRGRYLGFVK